MEKYYDFINECKLKNYSNDIVNKHHIIPRHMGGSDDEDNIILLSVEDHCIAHILLAECFEDGDSRRRSNFASAVFIKKNNKDKELILQYRKSLIGKTNPNFGKNWSEEKKQEFSENQKIKMNEPDIKFKLCKPKKDSSNMGKYDKSGENNPFYGKTHTEKTKEHLKLNRLGKKPSNTKKISIEGIIYEGLNEAFFGTNIKPTTIWHRIRSTNKKYINYFYIE